MKLTVDQIVEATGAQVLRQNQNSFEVFGIDSRTIAPGGLFFAIKGEQTDGHLFLQAAINNAAGGAVIDQRDAAAPITKNCTILLVHNSMLALQDLAAYARNHSDSKFIGITGSSGKTSTKEFTADLLSKRYSTYKTEGNLNSLTGLPLSLLSMEPREVSVLEVAMNHPGEIGRLSEILRPHVGVVMNVNPVHAESFDSIEEIADEKCSLIRGMEPTSTIVYNADDPLIAARLKSRHPQFTYGFSPGVDLRITDVRMRGVKGSRAVLIAHNQQIPVETALSGFGNLYNITAAASVALILNVPIKDLIQGISELKPFRQRGILIHANGIDIYDDTYNSNPKALEIVLRMGGDSKGYKRKIAILGDMLELGPKEIQFHQNAGEQVAANKFDILITAGALSKAMADAAAAQGVTVFAMETSDDAATRAAEIVENGDLVIVKGSRGIKMEKVIEKLQGRR